MNISVVDKVLAFLALFTGIAISAVAIYYSVSGLVSIFAAAAIPIIIMGVVLEVGKLVATLWLKQNWTIAPAFIKSYLLIAVVILMFITSMGIFGFLSKAHSDQSLITGGNQVQIQEIDRQIAIEQRNITDATKVIAQLDQAVQSLTDSQRIRGRDGAIAVRRSQTDERNSLNEVIKTSNAKISELEQQKLPLVQERLVIEAKVGPIKYIAALIYGDELDSDLLEKAVRWVIILIVVIFDPLAVVLLLASQYSFQNLRKVREEYSPPNTESEKIIDSETTFDTTKPAINEETLPDTVQVDPFPEIDDSFDSSKHPYLFNTPVSRHPPGVEPVGPIVYKQDPIIDKINIDEITVDDTSHVVNESVSNNVPEDPIREIEEGYRSLKKKIT
jgi:hypothetical protein